MPSEEQFGGLTVYHPRYPFLPKVAMPLHGLCMAVGSYSTVKRLATQGIDVIDSHFVYPDGMAAVILGKLLGVPVVSSARGTDINLYPAMRLIRPLLRWTVKNCQALIGVCTALSDTMVELGAAREKTFTIGNGVDFARFEPVRQDIARERLGVPRDAKVVVSVGGLIERKGFHLLIPAIAQLKQRGVTAKLYIAGEGVERTALERQIASLGLGGDVTLLGSIPNEQLKYWYSAADVSCLASSREGWANVLLESMACGTPVVASRIWGTPEVVVSEELGLLVEQETAAFADGLESALKRSWNRDAIVAHTRKRSWDVVAAEVEQVFAGVVGRKAQGKTA